MSQGEFDRYLALLSGLLRLNASQREAIACELRDHLEERLTALLAEGVPRQKAIETALEEFGDATGLAGEFVRIFRKQKRRWMMRMTLTTAGGLVAVGMLTLAFWPQGRPGPSLGRVIAQDGAAIQADETAPAAPAPGDADSHVDAVLRKRVDFDFVETPLVEALEFLGNQVGLQFYLKTKALQDWEIDANVPVSFSLKQVPLEMGLDLLLEELDLTYVNRDDVIVVTTPLDLESVASVRVYNCRDLLATTTESGGIRADSVIAPGMPGGLPGVAPPPADQGSLPVVSRHVLAQFGGGGGFGGEGQMGIPSRPRTRARQLMDILMTAIVPESWEEVGGVGTIAEFDGLIVIRHNPRIHRQVEQVLEMLREASAQKPWTIPLPDAGGALYAPELSGSY